MKKARAARKSEQALTQEMNKLSFSANGNSRAQRKAKIRREQENSKNGAKVYMTEGVAEEGQTEEEKRKGQMNLEEKIQKLRQRFEKMKASEGARDM